VAAWSAGLTARSGETARSYRTAVQRFLTTVDTPVSEASLRDVLFYVRDLSRSGLARATLAQHVSAIRSFLRYCQATEVSPTMPLDLLRRPRVLYPGGDGARADRDEPALRPLVARGGGQRGVPAAAAHRAQDVDPGG
jgi:Phage integrase, N-terminal SAM-like domain